MVQDISQRKRMEHLQFHDELTDLLNIRGISRGLKEEIEKSAETGRRLAVMCIRFAHDEFSVLKNIDIELEKVILKAVPLEAAERLSSVLFRDDLIACSGDNEYITLHHLPAGENISNSVTLIKKVLDTFRAPFANGIKIIAEVGVTFYPDDLAANNPNRIIANARYACEQAAIQSAEYAFYDEKAHLATREKIEFIKDLIIAVKEEKCRNFVLFYQAKIDAAMRIVGMEALVRWRNPAWAHPGSELVSPLLFIEAAEEIGLIDDLGRWVLENACVQTKLWQQMHENFRNLEIAVNVSPGQLNEDFVGFVTGVLKKTGLPPETLELEITERESIKEKNIRILDMFRVQNISIAIDDFGIEYSSLSKLPKLAINTIKLDKSYIDHIATDTDYEKLVTHTIGMVHGFNYHVVAEGVELKAQADKLFNEMNCDRIQGYFFSRPLPPEQFEKTLFENLVEK
jgi:EAL domain-containing protein (putative c-di-GMP-specific phosphodiesterase class I)